MNTARQLDAGVRPRIVYEFMTVEQAINGRNQDCVHHAECVNTASKDKQAKGFVCTNCPDYEIGGTAVMKHETSLQPMLFEVQPPFELRLVGPADIEIDYEIADKAISKLSGSIEALGILQTVILQKTDRGTLRVVGGKRRVLSAKNQGRSVPAMVFDKDVPEGTIWIYAAAENMMRAPNPGFEAEALQNILCLNKWTIKEASEKLGFPLQLMKERLKFTRLIPEMFKRLKAGTVTPTQAKRVASLPEEEQKRLAGIEKLTSADIQSAYRSNKFDELLEQEDLFETPLTMKPNLKIIRDQMKGILASAYQVKGDEDLLKEALGLVEKYEASLGGDL